MEDVPQGFLFLFVVLIIFSGFFSSFETALSNLNMIRLRNYSKQGKIKDKKITFLTENYESLASTVIVEKILPI